MIELYRTQNDALGAEIEDGLQELVLAHRVILVEPEQPPDSLPANTPLPALRDEGQLITGSEALRAHLQYLTHVAFEWRKFQSDACYIHEDGGNC
jgi:hypothetical protein